jgi:hypothetical protein
MSTTKSFLSLADDVIDAVCSDVPCQAAEARLGVLPPRSVLELFEVMIVQRWGRSLETSVIML